MGLLDDAIREHLELKRRSGAADEEVSRLENEVFGPAGATPATAPAPEVEPEPELPPEPETELMPELPPEPQPEPQPQLPPEPEPELPPEPEPAPARAFTDEEPWFDDPDEVPAEESLDHRRQPTSEFVAPDDEPEPEDVLEETPEFLSETPEHDRLWFEQKPPRDFDFGG